MSLRVGGKDASPAKVNFWLTACWARGDSGVSYSPLQSSGESSKLTMFLISLTMEVARILRGDTKRTSVPTYMERTERVRTWLRRIYLF